MGREERGKHIQEWVLKLQLRTGVQNDPDTIFPMVEPPLSSGQVAGSSAQGSAPVDALSSATFWFRSWLSDGILVTRSYYYHL